jgi:hypothetical protein
MFELVDGGRCFAAQIFDRVLVAEPVRALDRIVLPSDAAMPPCAATVWLRVGKTLVMQAVFSPAPAMPIVARKPAPPAPTTTAS